MISCHARDCQRKLTGTWVPGYPGTQGPGDQILGKYEVLLVPVTGISKPGNTREYPGNWEKGNTSTCNLKQQLYVCYTTTVTTGTWFIG